MNIKAYILGLGFFVALGCTCNDCEIRKTEPVFAVEFFSVQDNKPLNVSFESINGIPPGQIEVIRDGSASEYQFPLNMNEDSSSFVINSFQPNLADLQIDTLALTYTLELFQTDKDFVQFRADSMTLKLHTYDSASFICANRDCTNAEVTLRLFY